MTTSVLPRRAQAQPAGLRGIALSVSLVLTGWFLLSTGAPGEISTAPMATLPLALIPAFLVPMFLMLHTAALMQSQQMIRSQA